MLKKIAIILLSLVLPAQAAVIEIDGRSPNHVQYPKSEVAFSSRPFDQKTKNFSVDGLYIHDLINQKAVEIKASRQTDGSTWAYNQITLKNLQLKNIERDETTGAGLHIDFIRMAGGPKQDTKMNVLLENVVLDTGDAVPLLLTDGFYSTVHIKNLSLKNTAIGSITFKSDNIGSFDKIIIENSPGIGVYLMGKPGTIGEVDIINSANVRLTDAVTQYGKSGAVVVNVVPEPSLLIPLLIGGLLLRKKHGKSNC